MVSKKYIDTQLKKIGFKTQGWGRAEVAQLPKIILPDEEIYEVVNGIYEGGFALLVSSDIRVLLIDKKPLSFLTVEDLRFDMINEIDYNHRLFGAYITIATGNKTLVFRSYNKERLRKLIGHVQHCMADLKKQQTYHAEGQSQHLEKINKQLQSYLVAQQKQQQKLQDHLITLQSGTNNGVPQLPNPVKPSPELSDYLYARGLIDRYEEASGKDLSLPPVGLAQAATQQPPADNQLEEIYAEGMQEVFGEQSQPQSPTDSSTHGFDLNPLKIAYAKLPTVLRSRKFGLANISRPSFRPPVKAAGTEPEAA